MSKQVSGLAVAKAKELMSAAQQDAGLQQWGDVSFITHLEYLVDGIIDESQLPALAQTKILERLQGLLVNRLRLQNDRDRNPAIAREVIRRPIIILGLPRSGTTQLHTLLAQDPLNRTPKLWEMTLPSPPPEAATYDSDPRIDLVNQSLEARGLMTEAMRAIHPFHALLPEECSNIFEHCFLSLNFSATVPLPSYRRHRETADYAQVYEFHRQFLQHLQWHCPGERWVLKAPEHVLHLDALLETYPDAVVVQTHRDPRKVMPSNLDLVINLARNSGSRRDDIAEILRDECLANWSHGVAKTRRLRESPEINHHCIDIHFDEIVRDPQAAVAKIYAFAGLELPDDLPARIDRFLNEDTASKHGRHDYDAESLGLKVPEIDELFADYISHYKVR